MGPSPRPHTIITTAAAAAVATTRPPTIAPADCITRVQRPAESPAGRPASAVQGEQGRKKKRKQTGTRKRRAKDCIRRYFRRYCTKIIPACATVRVV